MQEHLKIAYTKKALELFAPIPTRKAVPAEDTDFTDTAALVLTEEDSSFLDNQRVKAFHIPVFLIVTDQGEKLDEKLGSVYGILNPSSLPGHFLSVRSKRQPPSTKNRSFLLFSRSSVIM